MAFYPVLPVERRQLYADKLLAITPPVYFVNKETGRISADRHGNSLEVPKLGYHPKELFSSNVTGNFDDLVYGQNGILTRSEEQIYRRLAGTCSPSSISVFVQPNGVPESVGSIEEPRVSAAIVGQGNITSHFLTEVLHEFLQYNAKTITSALNKLSGLDFLRDAPQQRSAITRLENNRKGTTGGRTKKKFRFVLNPYFVWCGHPSHLLSYLDSDLFSSMHWRTPASYKAVKYSQETDGK